MTTVSKKSEQKRLHSCVFAQSKEVKIRQKLGQHDCETLKSATLELAPPLECRQG